MNCLRIKDITKIVGRIGFRGYTTEDIVSEGDGAIAISPTNIIDNVFTIEKKNTFISWDKYYESPDIFVNPEDIVFVKTASVGKVAIIPQNVKYKLTLNPQLIVFKKLKQNKKFFYYVLCSTLIKDQLKNELIDGVIPNISQTKILNFNIPNPPLSQQTAIANYLDYHTTKLDKEISLLEQKVEKLDEYKQSLIYECVTKGLDKNVPMKDSGIEWIGMIPEHWEVKRVKDFSKCYAGGTPETNKDEYWENGTNYWAASGNLKNGLINLEILKKITDLATKNSSTKKINPFTTLIAMTGATCGEVGYSDTTIYANQSVCAIKNKKSNSNYKFLFYYLFSARKDVESLKLGGAQAGINGDDVKHIKIVFPNISEQQQIAEYLDEQCSKIYKKKELINKKIELLTEYKQSLIYEAVTGKITIGE